MHYIRTEPSAKRTSFLDSNISCDSNSCSAINSSLILVATTIYTPIYFSNSMDLMNSGKEMIL
uniref:Uncharacterized protein n=1 Tax=Salix viminalis TaxID=40686 RepID=A0A6N2K7B9_SALVM